MRRARPAGGSISASFLPVGAAVKRGVAATDKNLYEALTSEPAPLINSGIPTCRGLPRTRWALFSWPTFRTSSISSRRYLSTVPKPNVPSKWIRPTPKYYSVNLLLNDRHKPHFCMVAETQTPAKPSKPLQRRLYVLSEEEKKSPSVFGIASPSRRRGNSGLLRIPTPSTRKSCLRCDKRKHRGLLAHLFHRAQNGTGIQPPDRDEGLSDQSTCIWQPLAGVAICTAAMYACLSTNEGSRRRGGWRATDRERRSPRVRPCFLAVAGR